MARRKWHGHSCFTFLTDEGSVLLFDPFPDDAPVADRRAGAIEHLYTMGPEDAVRAVEVIAPGVVIPMHFNTWVVIARDPMAFARRVGGLADVQVLEPGGSYEF
jgi:L-ascorbate metabolism protein UlaG (beta-lactamase superfamily)